MLPMRFPSSGSGASARSARDTTVDGDAGGLTRKGAWYYLRDRGITDEDPLPQAARVAGRGSRGRRDEAGHYEVGALARGPGELPRARRPGQRGARARRPVRRGEAAREVLPGAR